MTLPDFDSNTGLFANPLNIDFGQDTFYFSGVAFSSSSRFIYTTCYNKTWQFDTWASDISASRVLVAELNTPVNIPDKTHFMQSRLAYDGKIYIAGRGSSKHLHVISHPNCLGLECDVQQYAIKLFGSNSYTMPNMPHYKQWSESDTCETVSSTDTARPSQRTIRLYPNPATQYIIADGLESGDEVQWFDISGRIIKTSIFQTGRFEIADLNPGFYLLKVQRKGAFLGIFKMIKENNMR